MLTDEEISEFVLKQKPKNTLTKTFIRCRIKRLLDILRYNTGYIWTSTQLMAHGSSNMTFQAVYSSKHIPVLYSKTSNNL